jgi:hypothetical protein
MEDKAYMPIPCHLGVFLECENETPKDSGHGSSFSVFNKAIQ